MKEISFIVNIDETELFDFFNQIKKVEYDFSRINIFLNHVNNFENKYDFNIINLSENNKKNFYLKSIKMINDGYVFFINSKIENISTNILMELNKINDSIVCFNQNKNEKVNISNVHLKPYIESYAFSLNCLKKIKIEEYDEFNLLNLFCCNDKIYFSKCIIQTTDILYEFKKSKIQYSIEWYIKILDKIFNKINNEVLYKEFLYTIMEMIFIRYNCNANDANKGVLGEDNLVVFENIVSKILNLIDDETIVNCCNNQRFEGVVSDYQKLLCYFMKLKYNKNIIYKIKKHEICINNVGVNKFDNEFIRVFAINYEKGYLIFDCASSLNNYFSEKDINIFVKYGNNDLDVEKTEFYTLNKVFGKNLGGLYTFSFKIKLDLDKKKSIKIYTKFDDKEYLLPLAYMRIGARLSDIYNSFWKYNNFILINKTNEIVVEKSSFFKTMINEFKFCKNSLKYDGKMRVLKLIFLRFLYYLTSYLKKKNIWITFDKLYKSGDNGEYIFKYILNKKKNIYYIIRKNSLDYNRMKKYAPNNLLLFNTLKAKLYSLHADLILDTHSTLISYCGFDGFARKMVSGLFNAKIVCIQHGLTIQQIAQYQNRLYDNIHLYCCASKYEIDNIKQSIYGYSDDHIRLTGLARYDGLKNNDKKIILITPTWRRNVVESTTAHTKKSHSEVFKSSTYFKVYNSLINNEKLIKKAKENNYRIVYLLHPAMSAQKDDYTPNEYVEVIAATGDLNYEKILTESSIMITDYSGVQFDFAYQRKPIIYYHPSLLPPHYDEGLFKYDTMGFGNICQNEEDLIEEILLLMKNDFKIEKKFKKRADDFFEYNDFNNCERIYDEVIKFLNDNKF